MDSKDKEHTRHKIFTFTPTMILYHIGCDNKNSCLKE